MLGINAITLLLVPLPALLMSVVIILLLIRDLFVYLQKCITIPDVTAVLLIILFALVNNFMEGAVEVHLLMVLFVMLNLRYIMHMVVLALPMMKPLVVVAEVRALLNIVAQRSDATRNMSIMKVR